MQQQENVVAIRRNLVHVDVVVVVVEDGPIKDDLRVESMLSLTVRPRHALAIPRKTRAHGRCRYRIIWAQKCENF